MGAILSRKKKEDETTVQKLEKIEGQIKSLEEHIQADRQREKKIWASFLFTTGFLYVSVAGILHLFVLKRETYLDYAKLGALWIFPVVLIYSLQRWIPWYFNRGIQERREKLRRLREEKKRLLDDVREKEPYNKAKTILEKYEGPQASLAKPTAAPRNTSAHPRASLPASSITVQPSYQKFPVYNPQPTGLMAQTSPSFIGIMHQRPPQPQFPMGRPPQMRERGTIDRVLDFIVKDGPENRMALICRLCGAHNGLCLLDEYDFTGFRCFECGGVNQPRKSRPASSNATVGRSPSLISNSSIASGTVAGGPRPPNQGTIPGSGSGSGSSSGSGSTSSHSEEEESQKVERHTATVKAPITVQAEEANASSTAQVVVSRRLQEGDTGSESDDEAEDPALMQDNKEGVSPDSSATSP
ncbi:hypothetical protein RvY_03986 [Ramazzottius varieornatus]|uniref:Endoplasmic reticulum junction formation protein lunapark n=1 Tax=Ramazzottius varieornatus TaxID=947166 RepID=A0A1D1UPZ1_RAMVA|nr:hypothetical protein RvY_03986 [Ramazzottius varieornatus]